MNSIRHPIKLFLSVSSMTLMMSLTPNISYATEVSAATLDKIMARLDRLEAENAALKRQVAGARGNKGVGNKTASIPVAHVSRPALLAPQSLEPLAYPKIETVKSPLSSYSSNRFVGAYGGLNVGYGWGLSNSARTVSFPLYDRTNTNFFSSNLSSFDILLPAQTGISAFSNSGISTINQSGIQGGLQVGYNLALLQDVRGGIESDIVGTSINGDTSYFGFPITQNQVFNLSNGSSITKYDYLYKYIGGGDISSGVSWIGTTRARLGYMPAENLLIYATGGLAYGGVYANTKNSLKQEFIANSSLSFISTTFGYNSSSGGDGRFSGTRFGYSAGGGIEWMFAQNLSLKAEAIYYNLGTVSFAANALDINLITNIPVTRITYDGIIGRTGINYHFNLE
jgi:opacity protein-like surface antigen